jgi:hypothetical protein
MRYLSYTILLSFLTVIASAQTSVTTSVNKNPVAVGEKFELTFTVLNGNISLLHVPSLTDFEIISGPNKTNSTQYKNGVSTESGCTLILLKQNSRVALPLAKPRWVTPLNISFLMS